MRFLTEDQKLMLRSDRLHANVLVTFFLDEGSFFFCDDVDDLTDGADTWIGASALVNSSEIKASSSLAAEGVTLLVDGTRMSDAGVTDPAAVLRSLFTSKFHQRRVDIDFGFRYADSETIQLIIPMYAGKINYARLVDSAGGFATEPSAESKLEIQLDSLAMRYKRVSYRTRSHEDHMQLTEGADQFFSYVAGSKAIENTLYWGKAAPKSGSGQVDQGEYAVRTALALWFRR